MPNSPQNLILASTSPFRKALLERLGVVFETFAPEADETPLADETAQQLVERLAVTKARAAEGHFKTGLVIGSDQVCVNQGMILGKPGNHETAFQQLKAASGQMVEFLTGLCLLNLQSGHTQSCVEPFSVQFRKLTDEQIERYLEREQPYNCAGSFKSEGLGVALFERMTGEDPNALIGLPTIQLIRMLANEQVDVITDF